MPRMVDLWAPGTFGNWEPNLPVAKRVFWEQGGDVTEFDVAKAEEWTFVPLPAPDRTPEIPDNERLGRAADQTIRRMIREEIAREKEGKPIRPYPEKEGG